MHPVGIHVLYDVEGELLRQRLRARAIVLEKAAREHNRVGLIGAVYAADDENVDGTGADALHGDGPLLHRMPDDFTGVRRVAVFAGSALGEGYLCGGGEKHRRNDHECRGHESAG